MVTVEGATRDVNPSLSWRRRWLGYAGMATLLLAACASLPMPGRADRPTATPPPADAGPAAGSPGRHAGNVSASLALASGATNPPRGAGASTTDALRSERAMPLPGAGPAAARTMRRDVSGGTAGGVVAEGVEQVASAPDVPSADAFATDQATALNATAPIASGPDQSASASPRPRLERSPQHNAWHVPVHWKGLVAVLLITIPSLLTFLHKRWSAPMNDPHKPDAMPLSVPVGGAHGFMPSRSTTGVHVLSASEVWAPNHASHRAPWEAPTSAEAFACLYKLGGDISPGLLFVGTGIEGDDDAVTMAMPQRSALADAVHAGMREEGQRPIPQTFLPPSEAQHAAPHSDEVHEPAVATRDAGTVRHASAGAHSVEPIVSRIEPDQAVVQNADAQNAREPSSRIATHVAGHPLAVPLVDVAFLDTPLAASTRREPMPGEPSTMQPQTAQVEAPASVPEPNSSRTDALADARALLGAGAHQEAIDRLSGVLQDPGAGIDAWVLASWAWWRIAQDSDAPAAYARAAEGMEEVLKRDPEQRDGWRRVGSCRLLQAERETGSSRRLALDQGIAALRHVVEAQGQAVSSEVQAQLADALMRRARMDDDRHVAQAYLAEAADILRSAARAARNPGSALAWTLQQALQAQARLLPGEAASKLHLEADAILDAGLHAVPHEDRRTWYAARVENELTHAALAEGATRMLHLRGFRERYAAVLTGPEATPDLLLSWLELLALETAHLRGAAAHARLDEGEAILARIDAMLPGNPHVAHARSRLLRRRASHSTGAARIHALTSALQSLQSSLEHADSPELALEVAEVLLQRAALLPQGQRQEDCRQAEALAAALCGRPALAGQALSTLIEGRLLESDDLVDPSLCARRLDTIPLDLRARELLARAALRNGQPQIACAHCEAAAQSVGGRLDSGLAGLWGAASRQWAAMPGAQRDPQWQANRQRLRAAG